MVRRTGLNADEAAVARRLASLLRALAAPGSAARPSPPRHRSTVRLGDWQRTILVAVARDTTAAWLAAPDRERRAIDRRGIPWRPRDGEGLPLTRAQAACVSRALRRLEDEGFVLRGRRPGSGRTVSVALTRRGWSVAQRLRGERLPAAPRREPAEGSV